MPSRMSCSLTTSSVMPARSGSSRGQHVDDQRAAADHVDPAGVDAAVAGALGAGHAEQLVRPPGAGRRGESRDRCTASGSYAGSRWATADSVVIVPATPTQVRTPSTGTAANASSRIAGGHLAGLRDLLGGRRVAGQAALGDPDAADVDRAGGVHAPARRPRARRRPARSSRRRRRPRRTGRRPGRGRRPRRRTTARPPRRRRSPRRRRRGCRGPSRRSRRGCAASRVALVATIRTRSAPLRRITAV